MPVELLVFHYSIEHSTLFQRLLANDYSLLLSAWPHTWGTLAEPCHLKVKTPVSVVFSLMLNIVANTSLTSLLFSLNAVVSFCVDYCFAASAQK